MSKPLYLALSGGGAHAAAHIGVIRGLERAGLTIGGVAGVSGGALVAAAWAGGASLDQLVDQASRLHPCFPLACVPCASCLCGYVRQARARAWISWRLT